MKHQVEWKGPSAENALERHDQLRLLVEEQMNGLERRLRAFFPDSLALRLLVDEKGGHAPHDVSVTLELPGRVITARQEGAQLESVVREVFGEVQRQAETLQSALRGERISKKLATHPETDQQQAFFSLVSPHLDELTEFVRHTLAYAQARDDVSAAETPEDLVDETLLNAYSEYAKSRDRLGLGAKKDTRAWLVDLAGKQIEDQIREFHREQKRIVHMQDDIPETPPEEAVSTLGDEILDFYQPDEDLTLQDIVPDLEMPSPEDEAAAAELKQRIRTAMDSIPQEWRRALLLRYSATPQKTDKEPDAGRILNYARELFRKKLLDLGCSFESTEPPSR